MATPSSSTDISYTLDAADTIIAIDGAWTAFATANQATNLEPEQIIGNPLWGFVRGTALRELYQQLLTVTRQARRSVTFPYRCDSPYERRYMEMTLLPNDDGSVTFRNRLVRSEARSAPLHVESVSLGYATTIRCSICGRFKVDQRWFDIDDAISVGTMLDSDKPILIAYGVCQDCKTDLINSASG